MWKRVRQVVNRVRGTLTRLERKTLSALIVIDVHARDIVACLQERGIQDENDFDWTSQLRCVSVPPLILQYRA